MFDMMLSMIYSNQQFIKIYNQTYQCIRFDYSNQWKVTSLRYDKSYQSQSITNEKHNLMNSSSKCSFCIPSNLQKNKTQAYKQIISLLSAGHSHLKQSNEKQAFTHYKTAEFILSQSIIIQDLQLSLTQMNILVIDSLIHYYQEVRSWGKVIDYFKKRLAWELFLDTGFYNQANTYLAIANVYYINNKYQLAIENIEHALTQLKQSKCNKSMSNQVKKFWQIAILYYCHWSMQKQKANLIEQSKKHQKRMKQLYEQSQNIEFFLKQDHQLTCQTLQINEIDQQFMDMINN